MRPKTKVYNAAGAQAPIPLDYRSIDFQVGFDCIVSGGGVLTYSVQHTLDDIYNPAVTPTWLNHATVNGLSATADGNYAFPIRAIRVNITAYTSGTLTFNVIQASGKG